MASLPQDKLDALETRFQYVEAALSGGAGPDEFVKFSKEHAELAPIVEQIRAYSKALKDRKDAEALLKSGDREMAEMAQAEIDELDERIEELFQAVRILLLPKDEADEKSIILEIRGGTGGDEAALFAGDLFRMYERYAANHGWKVTVMEESPGEMGGFKEIIANVSGKGVYARGVSIPRPPPWPCCRKSRRSTSISAPKISASIRCAPRVPVASTSTPPIPPCV